MSEAIEVTTPELKNHMIVYCDGGARPNPGFCGWGLHGYIYQEVEPKKGAGLGDILLTDAGYVTKAEFKLPDKAVNFKHVTPVNYIDGYGTVNYITTNNVGELTGAIAAVTYAKENNVDSFKLITDSEYVTRGINEYVPIWKSNNWRKRDGQPIANESLWRKFDSVVNSLSSSNIEMSFNWIKGHNGHLGNEIADKHATVAVVKASRDAYSSIIEKSQPEGYWKYNVNKHPFISHRRMYFNTLKSHQIPGQYYIGNHGKDDDMLGKKDTDGAYAFIALGEPDPMLEKIRDFQSELSYGADTLIMVRLDYVFNPNNHKDINKFDTFALYQNNTDRLDLTGLNREPVTREIRPAKLAFRAIESLSLLSQILDEYLSLSNTKYTSTIVTQHFFDIKEVVKKKETKVEYVLKSSLPVGISEIEIPISYEKESQFCVMKVKLFFGIDIPLRNSIKDMADLKPKIEIITWKESNHSFRYACVVTTDADKGIWAGVYSNSVIIP